MIALVDTLLLLIAMYYVGTIWFLYNGLSTLKRSDTPQNLRYSVVIAARNEEKNIRACLDTVLAQSMSPERYEVIVVNDRSTDQTAAILGTYQKRHGNLRVETITGVPPKTSPKKNAVAQGVSLACNEIIVFTDADCFVPKSWLETIDRSFGPGIGLVQGITAYQPVEGMNPHLFGMQAIDFLSHGVVAAAAIGANLPINSNANNFAFRKSVFEATGGYGGAIGSVVSGDDDLLLQRIWRSSQWKIAFMADLDGAVKTLPTSTVGAIFEQRKRWGSKTVHYGFAQAALLSGVFLFYMSIVCTGAAGLFWHRYIPICIGMLVLKAAGEAALMIQGTRMFGQLSLRKYLLPASLVQLPMVLAAVIAGVFGKFKWKDQVFRAKI